MIRLNLACGDDRRDDYINIDLREDVAGLVMDVSNLWNVGPGTVDEILALDILEHFPAFRTDEVLAEWRRVLKPGGLLILRVPNLLALAGMIRENNPSLQAIITNIYGGHRWGPDGALDTHHTGWTPDLIRQTLEQVGFEFLGSDDGLNMTIKARKSA